MPGAATALAVMLVVSSCALAACGTPNPYALPKYDPEASVATTPGSAAATSVEPTPVSQVSRAATPPPQVKYRPADAWGQGAWVARGRISARTPSQRAVVTATTKYLSVRVRLSNTWQLDPTALAAVASGEAATSAQQRVQQQQDREWRTVGRFVLNISSVNVTGSRATVTGCSFDATSEVDKYGGVAVAPPGGVRIKMGLQLTGDTWRVVTWPERGFASCDWRAR